MTFDQIAILGLVLTMLIAFATERFRVELVALSGLAAAFVLGLVPLTDLFSGASNAAVITVIEILLIVSVLSRTRMVEGFAGFIAREVRSERAVLATLCGTGALVSVFMNNIGALALMFPVALSICSQRSLPPARLLMPLSFATLLGGTCSLTGTPANLVVNDWKISETGEAFGYFALGSVGLPVAIAGVLLMIAIGPRLLRGGMPQSEAADAQGRFATEVSLSAASPWVGHCVADIESKNEIVLHSVSRDGAFVFAPKQRLELRAGDTAVLEASLEKIEELATAEKVTWRVSEHRVEAVVTPESFLVGSRIEDVLDFAGAGVSIVAINSRRRRFEGGLKGFQIGLGDVLVLEGDADDIKSGLREAALLALAPRPVRTVGAEGGRSLAVFFAGILATAIFGVPPEIAFGAVVLALAIFGSLRLGEGLQGVNWTIVILLACMIPLGGAIQDTGAAQVLANGFVEWLPTRDPAIVTIAMLTLAVVVTPFVDNVSVAAVLAPVAAGVATRAGMPVEPLLVAVAIGASLDFLTPFGHHNNAVVMGAAGYRFTDFPRLGLPLLGLTMVTAGSALLLIWV